MSDSKNLTVPLKNPITFGSQEVTELVFRPLKLKYMARAKADPETQKLGYMVELASLLTGQTEEIIGEVEGEDASRVLEVVNAFLGGFHQTGGES